MTIIANGEKFTLDELVHHDARMRVCQRPIMKQFQDTWNARVGEKRDVTVAYDEKRFKGFPADRYIGPVPLVEGGSKTVAVTLYGINYNPTPNVRKRDAPSPDCGMPYYLVTTVPERAGRVNCGLPAPYEHCPICSNMHDPGFHIFDKDKVVKGYFVGPNQNPIGKNHSLLVSADLRPQDSLHEGDVRTAMEYSYMMNQFLIYNMSKTGGTVDHLHFQGFDYDMADGYPMPLQVLLDQERVTKLLPSRRKNGGIQQFSLDGYPGKNQFFAGVMAPQNSMRYIKSLGPGAAYNLLVDREIVGVIPREGRHVSCAATRSKWAGLELWGDIIVGDVKMGAGGILVPANDLADSLDYDQIDDTMRYTILHR